MKYILIILGIWALAMTLEYAAVSVDNTQKQEAIDSLQEELFNMQNEVGRYELTVEHLKEVNPKAGKEFEDYLSHETE
jgi:tRNA(Ile)-lysidine synthase TilS/MesJ